MPLGDIPDAMTIIGLIICGGVTSLLFFFFFFDFFELDVPVVVVRAGFRDTSILSAETVPPSSVPLK